jgi:hypothetical protein
MRCSCAWSGRRSIRACWQLRLVIWVPPSVVKVNPPTLATRIRREVLDAQKRVLGVADTRTLTSANLNNLNLAISLVCQRMYTDSEAEAILREPEVLAVRKRARGGTSGDAEQCWLPYSRTRANTSRPSRCSNPRLHRSSAYSAPPTLLSARGFAHAPVRARLGDRAEALALHDANHRGPLRSAGAATCPAFC